MWKDFHNRFLISESPFSDNTVISKNRNYFRLITTARPKAIRGQTKLQRKLKIETRIHTKICGEQIVKQFLCN